MLDMGFFLTHIKVNIQLFKEKCLFLYHLKPSWVPCGTKTSLWKTWVQGITMSPRFHICLTGLDVSQKGHSLLSRSVQMASARPSGSDRVAAGTVSTMGPQAVPFSCYRSKGPRTQETGNWSHKSSTLSDGQWALERTWEKAATNNNTLCKALPHHGYAWRGPVGSPKGGWQKDIAELAVAAKPLGPPSAGTEALQGDRTPAVSPISRTHDPSQVHSLSEFQFSYQ